MVIRRESSRRILALSFLASALVGSCAAQGIVTLVATPNPATFGQPVTLTANVPGSVGKVTFFDGSIFLGVASVTGLNQATLTTSLIQPGKRSLRAFYSSTSQFSAPMVLIVNSRSGGAFSPGAHYASSTFTDAFVTVATGDFNNDGRADLVVLKGEFGSNPLFVLLGNANGTFQAPISVNYGTPGNPTNVLAGDFDGDGKMDLVVGYPSGTSNLNVMLGNGNGTFQAATPITSALPTLLAVGDFNGDGNEDIVVADFTNNSVGVLAGGGDGRTFVLGSNVTIQGPTAAVLVDVNNDGRTDLAVTGSTNNDVTVILNQISGIAPQTPIPVGTNPVSIVTGNFNSDANADLAIANQGSNNITVLLGNGNATFQAGVNYAFTAPFSLATSDVNGDGNIDLVVAGNPAANNGTVGVLNGNTIGGFTAGLTLNLRTGNTGVAVGDFNGDARPDLAVGIDDIGVGSVFLQLLPTSTSLTASPNPSLLSQSVTLTATVTPSSATGRVTFTEASVPIGSAPVSAGKATLTVPLTRAGANKLQANYSGDSLSAASTSAPLAHTTNAVLAVGFGAPVTYTASTGPGQEVVGDFNGDGRPDIAVSNSDGNLSILLGTGTGTFLPPINTPGVAGNDMVAADFNLDGKLDLAITTSGSSQVLLGNGDGTFQNPIVLAVMFVDPIAAADFNLDGKPDLIVTTGFQILVLPGNGNGTFGTAEPGPTGMASYTALDVGDLNNDGLPDFVSTSIAVTNQGDGILRRPVRLFTTGTFPQGVVVAEFNNDGNPDAAVVNSFSNNVSVALGRGDGTFQASTFYSVGTSPISLAAGDFNGDGKLDIAAANASGNNVSILTGNGDGTFQAAVSLPIGTSVSAVRTGDFNGDGRADLAVTTSAGVAILLATPPTFVVSPTSLTFNFTGGGPLPGAQTIQVSSNVSLPFDFGTSVFPAWLTVVPSKNTTPATLSVSVDPSSLKPGSYTTSFVVNVPTVGSQTVTVTFNFNPGVTTTTNFLVFTAVLGQPNPPPQNVGVSADGVFSASGSGFITVTTTSTGIAVGVNPAGLGVGDYNGSVVITSFGSNATINVLLRVRAPLLLTPSDIFLTAVNPGPVQTVQISVTSAPAKVSFSVGTPSASWASVDATGGTTPGTFNVRADPTGLRPGIYKAIINVTGTLTVPDVAAVIVTLTVLAPGPLLGITGDDLSTAAPGSGGAPVTFTFPLISSNQVPTDFTITVNGGFLTVFPVSGKTPALITVIVDPSKFAPGSTNRGSFTLTSAAGSTTKNIVVNALPPNPTLGVFPPVLEVQTQRGQKTSVKLLLQNPGGGGPQKFTVSVLDAQNNPFVTVVPSSGVLTDSTPVVVQVNIDTTSLAVGPYQVNIQVKFGDAAGPVAGLERDAASTAPIQVVPVSIVVSPADPAIALDFQGVKFDARKGEGLAVTQDVAILNLGDSPYTWTAEIVSGGDFISLASGATTGSSSKGTPGKITLSVKQDFLNAAGTAPGTYYASIRIRSPQAVNSPKLFTAVLNVLDANQADATPLPTPTGLVFTTPRGVDPAKQTVRLFTSSKSARAFQVSAQTYTGPDKTGNVPGINWLSTSVSSGTASTNTPGIVDVLVRTAGLAPGVYTGGVTFSLSSTAVRVVNVSLVVTPGSTPAKTARRLADASCSPTKLVPTFVGGLVNNFAQQVAGPVPISVKVTDDCGNLVPDPNTPGATPADVSITFSAGDPSAKRMLLTDAKNASYTITWVPDTNSTDTEVAVQARLGDLSGLASSSNAQTAAGLAADAASLIGGSAKVIGQVAAGAGPVLLPNATLNNLNPQPGGALAPGTLVQIFGSNLSTSDTPRTAQTTPLPASLNGTQVLIGGLPAPLYFVSKSQVNALVPFELVAGTQYDVIVTVGGAISTPSPISLIPATPGLAANPDGTIIAQHADSSLITSDKPALPGEIIILYLVGMGLTNPPVVSGVVSPLSPLAVVVASPAITIDDQGATDIPFAGLSPGSIGLYQINVRVPVGTAAGSRRLVVTQNGIRSNAASLPVGTK